MKNMGIYANKHKKRTEANIIYYATWSSLEMSTTIFIEELLVLYEYKGFGVGGEEDRGCGWWGARSNCMLGGQIE